MDKKQVYIETYGCSANQNNSEIMSGLLKQSGFDIVINPKLADIVILNSCIVKSPTENKIIERIKHFSNQNKKLIIAGCMPEVSNKIKEIAPRANLLGIKHVKDIVKLIGKIINKSKINETEFLQENKEIKLCMPKILQYKNISITQISEGCIGNCNFCQTKIAKGKLFSYPKDEIISSITRDLQAGCKEIWLTSQDNSAYGLDFDNNQNNSNLPELLSKIFQLKGRFWLRNGMMNPNNLLPILNKMIEIYKNDKIFKFLHIPLQSGSDRILKLMNRNYKVSDFLKIVQRFRKEIPNLTISTDIIVAFPSETEQDFQATIDIIKQVKPEILNMSKYWTRKSTKAAEMEQIDVEIAKKRVTELMKIYKEIVKENSKQWLGWKGKILVDKKLFNNIYLARNQAYKLIAVQSDENILGKWLNVRITRAEANHFYAEVEK